MKTAFLFPGQGSQSIGMGVDLYQNFVAARLVFDEVDEALHQHLYRLMSVGDLTELTQTQNAQPAIMAVGMAVVRTLEQELGTSLTDKASFMAGHSLGEYTALCAAGAMTLIEAAQTLQARGAAMARAGATTDGGMLAVLGLDMPTVEQIASQASALDEQVVVANDNCVGQVILSGHPSALKRAQTLANQAGAKRALPLVVSGAFHSPYMEPAVQEMLPVLEKLALKPTRVPVVANITALPESDPADVRANLAAQITGRVRWTETIGFMNAQGVDTFIECGAGRVLTGLNKRLVPEAMALSVGDSAGITACLTALKNA